MYRKVYFLSGKLDERYLLTNELGRYLFLDSSAYQAYCDGSLSAETEAYGALRDNGFLYEGNREDFIREWAGEYANTKRCLQTSTQLFILALTTACNQQCVYCQAGEGDRSVSMSLETCKKAIDIAVQSPTAHIAIEFQGGEPTLNPEGLRFAIPYAKRVFEEAGKQVSFAIVTNLTCPDPALLDWLVREGVNISTSLDGPRGLHDLNRPLRNGGSSHDRFTEGLSLCRSLYEKHGRGGDIGAIQTTSRASLSHPHEIVSEYLRQGYRNLYIRPLTPLGCAAEEWLRIGYTAEEFLGFYRTVLEDLFDLCKRGTMMIETTAATYLTRILCGESVNHTEFRSPCGAAIGQMAINYDGAVYTCDEGRMLANMGDDAFCLGTVENSYAELISSPVAHAACTASCVEALPLCCGCVYHPFCAVCPVVTYSTEGDLISHDPHAYHCRISKGILRVLFQKIHRASKEEMDILYEWAGGRA